MKKRLIILFLFFASYSFADQLAYITKDQADKAVQLISKLETLTLFCGCCDMEEPVLIVPTKVYSRLSSVDNYYEVLVEYVNLEGATITVELDLAYAWSKKGSKYTTIGEMLGLVHDYCVLPNRWNKQKKKKE